MNDFGFFIAENQNLSEDSLHVKKASNIQYRESNFRTLNRKTFRNTINNKVKNISRVTLAPKFLSKYKERKCRNASKANLVENLLREKKVWEEEKIYLLKKIQEMSNQVNQALEKI